ncbi:hypothetical protein [Gluconobacter frateurii]|uniref:Uncharacterized protein n=1 Tax=Gluconobacter frateurii NRIC 0228 TaxID=1307946 RepID=A0ABQ0QAH1_9PROT|nr:hypothetical protein [Gluconobacter frateurii]GBR10854.1 hypothetical protein AA0228_1188 [Gluconobacter frateurii NRIC 0228]GLP91442.1 hypothetical protein GCM10007868_25170 [Gluconobacter frateurii]
MSILHTLKRKLRSCRRQQDAVLADDAKAGYRPLRPVCPDDLVGIPPQPEVNQPAKKVELEPWVLAALERMESVGAAERLWKSEPTQDEIRAFSSKSSKEQLEILNTLLTRVNILRGSIFGSSSIFQTVLSANVIGIQYRDTKDGSE